MSELTETTVYRHFNEAGELLYVGIALAPIARLAQHVGRSHWAREIATVKIVRYESRNAALEAEADAIVAENPRYNKLGRPEPEFDAAAEMELMERYLAAPRARGIEA